MGFVWLVHFYKIDGMDFSKHIICQFVEECGLWVRNGALPKKLNHSGAFLSKNNHDFL